VGACAVLCAAATGVSAYRYTQDLISDRTWVGASDSLLSSLQIGTQRLDRVEFYTRLYLATHDRSYTPNTSTAVVNFQSTAEHLGKMVEGSAEEQREAQRLSACGEALGAAVDQVAVETAPAFPESELMDCRRAVADFTDSERTRVAEHTKAVADSESHSILMNMLFLLVSIGMVISLFVSVMREAHRRGEMERKAQALSREMAAAVAGYERRVAESTVLATAHDELQLCATLEDAYAAAARFIGQAFAGTRGSIAIINNSRQMIEAVSSWNTAGFESAAMLEVFAPDACCGLRAGHMRWRKPGVSEVQCTHFGSTPSETYLCKPLAAQGETLGVMCMECMTAEGVAHAEANIPLLRSILELASMSIASLQLRSKLQNQSIRDSLTSLFNRHFMEVALDREIHRAKRQHSQLAVLMLDIDHFKQFNDTFGHTAGDAVLREVAETFRKAARAEDIICRYGGEEFVMILPEIGTKAAYERAELVRELVTQIRLRHIDETLREITISIGIAMYPEDGETIDQLIRTADQRLYAAKRQGRNRVIYLEQVAV
jgi:diguanylate cyclase (GGDEF)-like protein